MEAVLSPGCTAISHGAAARLHGLCEFGRYDYIDVICRKGRWPHPPPSTITHFTRGLTSDGDMTVVDALPVLTVPATLALLAPTAGLGPTARALDSALRLGHRIEDIREAATRWSTRGRPGPSALLHLLDDRQVGQRPRR
jgi:hypothetical protein